MENVLLRSREKLMEKRVENECEKNDFQIITF